MSATALRRPARAPVRPVAGASLLSARVARALGLFLLGGYGLLHWGRLVEPAGRERLLLVLLLGAGAGLALARGRGLRAWLAAVGALAVVAVVLPATLLLSGVPLRALAPRHLDRLGHGLASGLDALPSVQAPLAESAGWTRTTILLGGAILLILGSALALATRRRALAAVVLLVLAGAPAVAVPPRAPVLQGGLLAVALAAFLWLDRIPRADAGAAAAAGALALAAGLVAAPVLDRDRPLLDPVSVSDALRGSGGVVFDWNQRYGPLDWPREGREVLSVRARSPAYWKAENLERFDGVRWRSDPPGAGALRVDPAVAPNPSWRETVRMTVRGMRTRDLIGAGTTSAIDAAPQQPLAGPTPGMWRVDRPLAQGDSYLAEVYVPRPSPQQLAGAGDAYPPSLAPERTLTLPGAAGAPAASVTFPPFAPPAGSGLSATTPALDAAGEALVRRGPYARVYALARRLALASSSPEDFRRRVQRYLGRGFRYSELAPRRAVPLASFLFRDRAGSCQMFSGAMALLLRMGGVPARVAAGFTPGELDKRRGELAVTDSDAHAWVEAWFPGLGWILFDPTPTVAPARGGSGIDPGAARALRRAGLGLTRGDVPLAARGASGAGGAAGGVSGALVAGLIAAGLLAGAAAFALLRRRAGRPGRRPRASEPDRAVAELARALRVTGRRLPPTVTLRRLEARYAGSPDILDYLRTLRAARFGGADGVAPSAVQRRALRRGLADGLGLAGRLRALRGLPPRWLTGLLAVRFRGRRAAG